MDKTGASNVYVGTAGWQYPDWKGIVYPQTLTGGATPLALLTRWCDMVEINVTFYRPVAQRQCVSWLAQTAAHPRFLFCAKLPAALTHKRGAAPDGKRAAQFRDSMSPLIEANKLAAVLAQFPWSFKRTAENRRYLAQLADQMEGMPLAVEVRHTSWNHPDFRSGLARRGIALCNIDQPALNACLAPSGHITAPFAYVRLHGRNKTHWFNQESGRDARYDYLYTRKELTPWIEKIQAMGQKVNKLFVVTNNHYRGQAVANALEIQALLGHPHVTPPETLSYLYPSLRNLPTE